MEVSGRIFADAIFANFQQRPEPVNQSPSIVIFVRYGHAAISPESARSYLDAGRRLSALILCCVNPIHDPANCFDCEARFCD
jgi:hypothetical protein